jgi:AcrR family transcriptional regulator
MQREEKSERSRRAVLDAALQLFSHQGYRGTSVREIAEAAGVSTGNLYHHFPDKETIFQTLLDEYWQLTETKRFPFNRALTSGIFPDNIEQLGYAARDSVREYARYILLIYVDVIEFDGAHVQRFYSELGNRLVNKVEQQGLLEDVEKHLRAGVSPRSALALTTRFFFNYFAIEIIFGVREPFQKPSMEVVKEIADILRYGMVEKPS